MRRLSTLLSVFAIGSMAVAGAACSKSSSAASKTPSSRSTTTAAGATVTLPVRRGTCASTSTTSVAGAKEASPPGDIPDGIHYPVETGPALDFTVGIPEGWARSDQGGAVIFSDKFNSARLEESAAPAAPTVATARSKEVPAIEAAVNCFRLKDVKTVSRPAGVAVLITYYADSPPDAVTDKVVIDDVERYEFWRNGREAIVTLSGSKGSDNVDPWNTVTTSFRWK